MDKIIIVIIYKKPSYFDGFTSIYDNRICIDTWNLLKIDSEICNGLIKYSNFSDI